LADVFDEIGPLVRVNAVNRHRLGNGLVRYSIAPDAAAAAVRELKPHLLTPCEPKYRPAPKAEALLAVMGSEPMHATAILAASAGRFTSAQVACLLQVLKRRGEVKKISGSRSNAMWKRASTAPSHADGRPMATDTTLPPHLAAAQRVPADDDEELPPWLGERMRDTFHDIFHAAADAATDKEQ